MGAETKETQIDGAMPTSGPQGTRQRRSHRKSRLGCSNCKLRGIKCDESKPICRRCTASGFTCSYVKSAGTLQLAHTNTFQLEFDPRFQPKPPPLRIPVTSPIGSDLDFYELRPKDMAALSRFEHFTVWTMSDARVRELYAPWTVRLGSTSPFLLHLYIAITLLHDAHLNPSLSTSSYRSTIAFHFYHATSLFKRKISEPLSGPPAELDALWVACALLGSAAFGHVDSLDPELSWPLKKPEPTDLDWLGMSEGKNALIRHLGPERRGSLVNELLRIIKPLKTSRDDLTTSVPLGVLPADMYPLLGLDETSTPETNPYHTAASILAQLWPFQISPYNVAECTEFSSHMDRRFRGLLQGRDERAMLLVAYWFSKIYINSVWWMQRRALAEGQAICIYLERHCNDSRILRLNKYPMSIFEMARGIPGT